MFKLLWEKKLLILFLAILVALLPQGATRPAQMLSKTLFVSVGIDKTEDGQYEVSGEMIVNQYSQTGERKSTVISETASTASEAFNKISKSQGRHVSLAHCTLMVIGNTLKDENLANILVYFFHKTEINNNCALVWSETPVKKLFEVNLQDASAGGGLLHQIQQFNQKNIFNNPPTLERFYKDYLRPSSSTLLSITNFEKPEEEPKDEKAEGGESAEASASPSAEKKEGGKEKLPNTASSAVFKNGKYAFNLSGEQMEALNFLSKKATEIRPTVETENIRASLQVIDKNGKINTQMKDGKPHVSFKIETTVEVEECTDKNDPSRYLDKNIDLPASEITAALKAKIIGNMNSVTELMKIHKADFLHQYDVLYHKNTKEFKNYIKNKTIDDFMTDMTADIEVTVNVVS